MAAAVFLRWLTEQQRNLEFAADTGYMPVSSAAFDAIADYPFEQQSYQRLYDVYNEMRLQNTPLSEPGIVGYHAKAKALYDSLHNTKKDTTRSLEIQYSVFQNDMERYFDQLAVMGVNLSEDMGALVDQQLANREMTFEQLNDSPEVLNALEEKMIEPLCRSLRRTSCSGVFVLLDATVNTRMEGAGYSRAGLYVQKGGTDTPHRAPAALPRQRGCGQDPQRDAPPQMAHGIPDRPVPGLRPLDDLQQHPAVPGLYADGAVQPPRHLGGGAAVFAAPAGPRRHHVRAVRF